MLARMKESIFLYWASKTSLIGQAKEG